MKAYIVKTKLRSHSGLIQKLKDVEDVLIIHENDNLNELLQMKYGCWYDIIDYQTEEITTEITISKTILIEEAKKLFKYSFE